MAGQIVYADLDIVPKESRGKRRSLPQPGASASPRWHRMALWLGWSSSLVLGAAVLALGSWVHHLQSEKPGNVTDGHRDVTPADCRDVMPADFRDAVADVHRRLRVALCPPQGQDSAEGDGCRLCPPGWTRRGRKCYWVADRNRPWDKSWENCTSWDAELLRPEDCDELEFVKDIAKKPSKYFWINLSSLDQSRILLNGSCLDQSRLPLGSSKGCRALKGDRIVAEDCDSAVSWICQKTAIAI
uniref:C-type lectin domain-containing protein n=1 Tax=Apteryx owenii TaxID=8824 RepID=A0A8B9PI73_APTOW